MRNMSNMIEVDYTDIKGQPVENTDEHQWHIPVRQYGENLSIVEAYNDPQLQPVVVMKRLSDTLYSELMGNYHAAEHCNEDRNEVHIQLPDDCRLFDRTDVTDSAGQEQNDSPSHVSERAQYSHMTEPPTYDYYHQGHDAGTSKSNKSDLVELGDSNTFSNTFTVVKTFAVVPQQSHTTDSDKRIECELCGARFKFRCRLERHLKVHTGEKPHSCSFCDRKFQDKWLLKMHELGHKGQLPQCTVCGGRYVNLREHMLIHSDTNKQACFVCNKQFRRDTLKQHMLTHSLERPFQCQHCGYQFQRLCKLKKHMTTHTQEKHHVCSVCGVTFLRQEYIVVHMRTHTGERPYCCETCGREFRQRTALNRHKLIHSGVQPYECSVCGMRFNQSNTMKRHMLVHTGEQPYCCSDCGQRFTQSGGLAFHRRRRCPRTCKIDNQTAID